MEMEVRMVEKAKVMVRKEEGMGGNFNQQSTINNQHT
jgi:hypothetical protein